MELLNEDLLAYMIDFLQIKEVVTFCLLSQKHNRAFKRYLRNNHVIIHDIVKYYCNIGDLDTVIKFITGVAPTYKIYNIYGNVLYIQGLTEALKKRHYHICDYLLTRDIPKLMINNMFVDVWNINDINIELFEYQVRYENLGMQVLQMGMQILPIINDRDTKLQYLTYMNKAIKSINLIGVEVNQMKINLLKLIDSTFEVL